MDESRLFLMVSLLECQRLIENHGSIKCVLSLEDQVRVSKPVESNNGRCFFNQQFIFPFKCDSELKVIVRPDDGRSSPLVLRPSDCAIDVVFSKSPRVNVPVADWFALSTTAELTGAVTGRPRALSKSSDCGRVHLALVVFDTMFLKSVISQVGVQAGSTSLNIGGPGEKKIEHDAEGEGEGEANGTGLLLKAWKLLAQRV